MKTTLRLSTLLLLSLAFCATVATAEPPSDGIFTLDLSCPSATDAGCPLGVTLLATGDGYPNRIYVVVTRPNGSVSYEFGHLTDNGQLVFNVATGTGTGTEADPDTGTWRITIYQGRKNVLIFKDFEVAPLT